MTRKEFLKYLIRVSAGAGIAASSGRLSQALADTRDLPVLVIGAGAAGLMAGYELQRRGIDFRILEASAVFGGRVRKTTDFTDFPLDLGAEWIHSDEPQELFRELLDDEDIRFEADLLAYQPAEFIWEEGRLEKEPSLYTLEYKFKNTTWHDFLDLYLAPASRGKIHYNSPVTKIDYAGTRTLVTTGKGEVFTADQLLVTVPLGVLKAGMIAFSPPLPPEKVKAIRDISFPPGLKVFFEFSDKFYPDAVETPERYYYDAAFGKDTARHILGLFCVGEGAESLIALPDEQAVVATVLGELDRIFAGKASALYQKHIVQNWSAEPYVRGSYSHNRNDPLRRALLAPLGEKVYFAGEALDEYFDSTVDGAAFSALSVLEEMI
ncbi:NAD(P)/FAD-dependent oxidoreductase [Kiloniella laminariae]|uniref:Tryptophan 2-monooxygenase n=1 Tax=Kiloniella laminariae TaxID=454162 RepID=A0ABT4LF22_9PROT|nr:NAD(P)/FAD-dependent oxidoreductase [Kiloniella laminariae]MCZ4279695.1 NAD(P)/FAD-dependent oxidoreductase [Kiloniella laminariae]